MSLSSVSNSQNSLITTIEFERLVDLYHRLIIFGGMINLCPYPQKLLVVSVASYETQLIK